MAKTKLDKDLKRLSRMEYGAQDVARRLVPVGLGLLFLVAAAVFAASQVGASGAWALAVGATVIGAYMALNIGANDVANNMSPAVGSRALTIGVAVLIAAVFEAAGAIIAGGDVVETVSKGIIDPARMPGTDRFVLAMVAALFAAALWINVATWLRAPVSTTHSVVGGVLGGGVAMAGLGVADWSVVAAIVASWVVSPLMGGVIAAGFLAYLKRSVYDAPDRLSAAAKHVPLLVAIMVGAFAAYLMMKGLSNVLPVSLWLALAVGLLLAVPTYFLVQPRVRAKLAAGSHAHALGDLFTIPVICGSALLSFAHGANDVANAIGPLSAIHAAISGGVTSGEVQLPFWILLVGAFGIAVGLALFGPPLIRTVGSKITKLNRVRAFCVTLSAAITVIFASALGLPVSSTHTAIGALFGVGFLREYLANRDRDPSDRVRLFRMNDPATTTPLPDPGAADVAKLRAKAEKQRKRYLVRRSHVVTIAAAWIITVPCSALLAAGLARLMLLLGVDSLIQ